MNEDAFLGGLGVVVFLGAAFMALIWLVFPFLIMNRVDRVVDRLDKTLARLDRIATDANERDNVGRQWSERADELLQAIEKNTRRNQ
jgi:hypothetical protein